MDPGYNGVKIKLHEIIAISNQKSLDTVTQFNDLCGRLTKQYQELGDKTNRPNCSQHLCYV